ncbi:Galactose binding domain like protein [Mucinivorans hirudinis]|uniref:Galactose binding domain like protein n=1 Tax=Mucinivorans hirudinis TaxID=1433126 RepID=A0A060REP5_9BACT|nr:Galactose binding domain like protein [Mucinivorans hirudinis]
MKNIISIITLLFLVICCKEKTLEPITPSKGKPEIVTEVAVQNLPGAALIKYKIPQSEDLIAVRAVYKLDDGVERRTEASFYNNEIKIEGFNQTKEYQVVLYSVNRAEQVSDPVVVKISPSESPLSKVAKSMNIVADFGGARFLWENRDRAPLVIELLSQNDKGSMQAIQTVYSSTINGLTTLRGFDAKARKFGAIVRDKWNNSSDTIWAVGNPITPIFEQKAAKNLFKVLRLANDIGWNGYGYKDYMLFDEDYSVNNFAHSESVTSQLPWPVSITIDLGQKIKLSRMRIWQRPDNPSASIKDYLYKRGNPRFFTVYGLAELPENNPQDWSHWTQSLNCEVIKPSGSGTIVTNEDIEAATAGHEFEFPLSDKEVRYIRIKFTETWERQTYCHPTELTFWGQIIK